jgi:hypothetical protein
MSDEEELKRLLESLRATSDKLTKEQLEQARILASFFKLQTSNQDHEGTQIFPIKNYKRRN